MSLDGFDAIRVSVGDRVENVATVALDRPDARNALSAHLQAELNEALSALAGSDVRAIVLTGSEESGVFAAGGDVTELREQGLLERREKSRRPRMYGRVADLPIPVIARINGHALGGGCELAMACDVRIARRGAKLGQPEISLGLIPGGGGTQRLPRLVGEGQALRLILSGELVDADEAADIGLVDSVHDDEEFDERVYGLAGRMASKSPIALELAKKAVRASPQLSLRQGIEYEAELFAAVFATEDKNEGIDAFLEDREPEWTGR